MLLLLPLTPLLLLLPLAARVGPRPEVEAYKEVLLVSEVPVLLGWGRWFSVMVVGGAPL